MDAPTYQTIKRLYLEARALAPEARERFLAERCAERPEMRAEVEGLLVEAGALGGFLARPAALDHAGTRAQEEERAPHPERIGSYRILRPLGFGGMGVVYLAEQDSPKRAVALKLLRHDSASPRQVERFAQEAELLGRLNHPGIARVYEAGWAETETGKRPFFAMEHVEGRALHEYVRAQELDLRAKLRLVSEIAEAVHYAHQRGVLHRDLKPSNVLVDERGAPKVLDFGVARPLSGSSHATQTGQLVGTLAYMSPEQAASAAAIDARSDVYALGALLYELLTGRLPIPTEGLPLHEAVRRVREEEPIAAASVRPELAGELDVVLGKALAKDRERRYASAAELADDLRLFLENRPIRARRPTPLYVTWKLVRRHRLLAASVLALFLVTTAAQYGWLVLREREREVRRNQAELAREGRRSVFFHDLVERSGVRDEARRLRHEGDLLVERLRGGKEPPSEAQLERWLAGVARVSARLDQHWHDLAALQAWADQPEAAEPIATPEEKEYALAVQRDIVDEIEFTTGPRGPLPILRTQLERLQRTTAAAEASQ